MPRGRLVVTAALIAALTGCGRRAPDANDAVPDQGRSTTQATLIDADGDGALDRGPGEPVRDAGGRAHGRLRVLATFGQLTDAHVRDVESPARLPFLDRFGPPLQSTFRPQEALGLQTLESAVEALNAQHPDVVVQTGDLADNAQRNELVAALAVLHGGVVHPGSGTPGPGGPQLESDPDPLFYRPDLDPPRHPGLLDAAQHPFPSPGLHAPLVDVPGNHDLLVQGELAPDAELRALAVGDQAVTRLDPRLLRGVRVRPGAAGEGEVPPEAVRRVLDDAPRVHVAADPGRRLVTSAEADTLLRTPASGVRSFAIGSQATGIALDLVDPAGGSQGLVTPAVLRGLQGALRAAGTRPVVVFSHQTLTSSRHGDAALALLEADPHVLAAVAGHTHANAIRRQGRLWLITTASLADFPQQVRTVRIVADATGRLALETWVVDHGSGPGGLAATSRELAFLDAQGGRPDHLAGRAADRNRRLWTDVHVP